MWVSVNIITRWSRKKKMLIRFSDTINISPNDAIIVTVLVKETYFPSRHMIIFPYTIMFVV